MCPGAEAERESHPEARDRLEDSEPDGIGSEPPTEPRPVQVQHLGSVGRDGRAIPVY